MQAVSSFLAFYIPKLQFSLSFGLFQEKDFEFTDDDFLDEPYGSDTLQDDEDYQGQQPGSGFGGTGKLPVYSEVDITGSGDVDDIPTESPGETTPGNISFIISARIPNFRKT